MLALALGNVVVNFGTVARVVGFHAVGVAGHPSNGDPILRQIGINGRLRGGKWVADPAKCRLLTADELRRYHAGDVAVITAEVR